jgi:two-component system sensor histidine kinase UhpB
MRKLPLFAQILAVNAVLLTATVLAALTAAQLDVHGPDGVHQGLLLAAAILATVLVNGLVLRRRFAPLERLINAMEHADLEGGARATVPPDADSADVVRLYEAFNRMLGRLEQERAASAAAVLQAQENERARVARDLHDEVNQSLTGILLRLEATAAHAPPALREELASTKALASQAMQELLRLARELRPSALDDHGLDAALRTQVKSFAGRTGKSVALELDAPGSLLAEEHQLVVYRVVQESLSNVAEHADAERVLVAVRRDAHGQVVVEVSDDGRGFIPNQARGHGLPGMRERARLAGGRVDVHTRAGAGTTVELHLPVQTPS